MHHILRSTLFRHRPGRKGAAPAFKRGRRLPAMLAAFSIGWWAPTSSAQMPGASVWMFEGAGCESSTAEAAACPHQGLVAELLQWVGQQMRVTNPTAPVVLALDQAAFGQRLCPESPRDCQGIMAAYEAATRTVVLRAMLDMRRAPDRSFLVHELVHVVQHQQAAEGFQARCRDVIHTEREAYGIQNRYLAMHGQLQRVGQMIGALTCPSETGEPVMRVGQRLPNGVD